MTTTLTLKNNSSQSVTVRSARGSAFTWWSAAYHTTAAGVQVANDAITDVLCIVNAHDSYVIDVDNCDPNLSWGMGKAVCLAWSTGVYIAVTDVINSNSNSVELVLVNNDGTVPTRSIEGQYQVGTKRNYQSIIEVDDEGNDIATGQPPQGDDATIVIKIINSTSGKLALTRSDNSAMNRVELADINAGSSKYFSIPKDEAFTGLLMSSIIKITATRYSDSKYCSKDVEVTRQTLTKVVTFSAGDRFTTDTESDILGQLGSILKDSLPIIGIGFAGLLLVIILTRL